MLAGMAATALGTASSIFFIPAMYVLLSLSSQTFLREQYVWETTPGKSDKYTEPAEGQKNWVVYLKRIEGDH